VGGVSYLYHLQFAGASCEVQCRLSVRVPLIHKVVVVVVSTAAVAQFLVVVVVDGPADRRRVAAQLAGDRGRVGVVGGGGAVERSAPLGVGGRPRRAVVEQHASHGRVAGRRRQLQRRLAAPVPLVHRDRLAPAAAGGLGVELAHGADEPDGVVLDGALRGQVQARVLVTVIGVDLHRQKPHYELMLPPGESLFGKYSMRRPTESVKPLQYYCSCLPVSILEENVV